MLKLVLRWLLMATSLTCASAFPQTHDFTSAAGQFAAKITAHRPPGTVSFILKNRSSLSASSVAALHAELSRQLETRGWKLKKPEESEESITVTLAENLRAYVWTAEIGKPESRTVVLFEQPRTNSDGGHGGDRVSLSRTLLLESNAPLLDVTLLEGKMSEGAHLVALTPAAVQLYQFQSAQWHLTQTQPLGKEPMATRDLRGQIVPGQGSSFDAYLPAMHCSGVVTLTLSVICRESDDPWPLSDDRRTLAFFAANRNYFNGVISGANLGGGNTEPFYSAAILSDRIIYAALDGHRRVAVPGRPPSAVSDRWGSSIASIQLPCHSDLVLATANGDFNQSDSITAFLNSNSEFNSASEPILFYGPVLSLKNTTDRQQAIAVVLSQSGRYEAYLLTARCGA